MPVVKIEMQLYHPFPDPYFSVPDVVDVTIIFKSMELVQEMMSTHPFLKATQHHYH